MGGGASKRSESTIRTYRNGVLEDAPASSVGKGLHKRPPAHEAAPGKGRPAEDLGNANIDSDKGGFLASSSSQPDITYQVQALSKEVAAQRQQLSDLKSEILGEIGGCM